MKIPHQANSSSLTTFGPRPKNLEGEDASVQNQKGLATQKPTFKWATELMRDVTKITLQARGEIHSKVSRRTKCQQTIVKAFGSDALAIYPSG